MPAQQKYLNVDVFENVGFLSVSQKLRLERILFDVARDLVQEFNQAIHEEVLYLVTFAGCWVLYGRPTEEHIDQALLYGIHDVDDLVRLISRLEGIMYKEGCD